MTRTMFAREVVSGGPAALPPVTTRVTVTPAGSAATPGADHLVEALSLVEDLRLEVTGRRPGPAEIVIARPVFSGDLEAERPGARYVVRWVTDRGVHEVPVRYVSRERIGPVVLGWRLTVTGPVSRIQRRAHARVDLAVPVQVAVLDDSSLDGEAVGVGVLTGRTINLSEGGMLACLNPPVPVLGAAVVVRFEIAEERFVPTGTVVRLQPTSGPAARPAVAVQFDRPDAHGDRLRPLLFAHQLHARRLGVS